MTDPNLELTSAVSPESCEPLAKDDKPKVRKNKRTECKIKFEAELTNKEAASYFRAIVDGLGAGSLLFKQGEKSLELSPSGPLTVEVKASVKNLRQKVSFEIEWRTGNAKNLTIGS